MNYYIKPFLLFILFIFSSCNKNEVDSTYLCENLDTTDWSCEMFTSRLTELFEEINELSTSVACTDASEWTFIAYGARACGGPQGYIPYSKSINSDKFICLVNIYTNIEQSYNETCGIYSICAFEIEPSGIVCDNGIPTLTY